MNSASKGNFVTTRNFVGCEISQVAKFRKPGNFYIAARALPSATPAKKREQNS